MVEKKIIVDGLRLSYNGVFDITEFYKKVEDWIRDNELEKETKKKLEHVEPAGKKLEWFIECWENVAGHVKAVVRVRALFADVREIRLAKDKSGLKLNHGSALIIFDGWLETDFEGKWQQEPWYYFLKMMIDKYIYHHHLVKFENKLSGEVYGLHKVLQSFFNSYKY